MGVFAEEEPELPPPPPPPAAAKAARSAPPPRPVPPPRPEPEVTLEQEESTDEQEIEVPTGDVDVDFEAEAAAAAAAAVAEIESQEAEGVPLVEAQAAPPTWDEILQDCLYLARAAGALLIDGAGQVMTSCGDWPAPGVESIANRLVPAMEKALLTAPTRSVSVPIGKQHLTAWRVPMGDNLLTVGFVADAPLKAEVRPAIDAEVKRGAV